MEHIRVVEDVKRFYALGYDMNSEADLRALNDAYALLTEELGASLTSGDMELLSPFSAYGCAGGLTFAAEKAAPAGNAAYQSITAGMGKVMSYHVGLDRLTTEGGTAPAGKFALKQADTVKLPLPASAKATLTTCGYTIWKTSRPRRS